MPRLLIASPHRYPDLARLWHRFVMRELAPEFGRLHLTVETNIFCDANADQFLSHVFPGVGFTRSGPGMRDFMEFYDATLNAPCDFILFLDADTFLLDGDWACSYFAAFTDPSVAAVSLVPRKGAPAIFALLCRAESFRALPAPAFACRYEFPEDWPQGVNLQPGDYAARELVQGGKIVINVDADESSRHTVNFRGTTGLRSSREHITRAAGERVFLQSVAQYPACLIAAYDNVLLGCLYESLYHEPFAPDSAGRPLGASLTIGELRFALKEVRDVKQLESLHERFHQSHRNILRMAAREGVELSIPSVLPQ
ncbi:MAG TPA: hypothetical protein VKR61_02455 [Bryobacteraceae bacterium]|nr:hypothetical protein [Bryobacteraceae bacterium]